MGHVEVGVQPQLAEPPAGTHRSFEQLVAQQTVSRVERLGGTEQLLLLVLPFGRQREARILSHPHRRQRTAAIPGRRVRHHHALAGSRYRNRERLTQRRAPRVLVIGRQRLVQQGVRNLLRRRQRHPGVESDYVHVLGLQPSGRGQAQHLDDGGLREFGLLVIAYPGVGDRGDRACELARGRLRRPSDVCRRQLPEPRQRAQPVDDIGLRREQLLAAKTEAVNQTMDVQVRAGRVDRGQRGAVELQEHADPLAGLRRDLRRFGCGGERGDHVELPPAGDLGATGDVDCAQFDRCPGQRADDGARVRRVREQSQPGEHVADLGALEERRLADEAVRDSSLLEGDRNCLALARRGGDEHRHRAGQDAFA